MVNSKTVDLNFTGLDKAGGQVVITALSNGKDVADYVFTSEGAKKMRMEVDYKASGGLSGVINLYSLGSRVASFPAGPSMPEVIVEESKVTSLTAEDDIWPLLLLAAMYCTRVSGDGNGVTSWEWDCCRCLDLSFQAVAGNMRTSPAWNSYRKEPQVQLMGIDCRQMVALPFV